VPGAANQYEITPIIVTIGPPAVVQAILSTPNSGSGISQLFTLTYSDSAGVAADLNGAFVQFANVANPALICRIQHRATTGQVRILGDDNLTWGPFVNYGGGTLSNSRCSLNLATSTATPSGNNLTLAYNITFAPAFAGPATIKMRAQSLSGPNTGFLSKGTWTVGPTLQAVSINPINSSGLTQTFVLAFSDSAGVTADLVAARVRFRAPSGVQCNISYNAIMDRVRIVDDLGNFGPFVPLGSGSPLTNSQCSLDLVTSSAVRSGTDLTLTLAITFKSPAFTGVKSVDMRANSSFGTTTDWVNKGNWTVP
jgi:hypothetical protein